MFVWGGDAQNGNASNDPPTDPPSAGGLKREGFPSEPLSTRRLDFRVLRLSPKRSDLAYHQQHFCCLAATATENRSPIQGTIRRRYPSFTMNNLLKTTFSRILLDKWCRTQAITGSPRKEPEAPVCPPTAGASPFELIGVSDPQTAMPSHLKAFRVIVCGGPPRQ